MSRRLWRRGLVAGGGVVVGLAVLLGVEIQLARTRPTLPDRDPFDLDGLVGAGRPGPTLDVVWLGDSTAAGVGASSPARALPRLVAAGSDHPVDLTVLAVSGARIDDVLDHQAPRLEDLGIEPDVVFISVGANDVTHLTRRDDFRRRYLKVVERLPPAAELVLLGVPDMGAPTRLDQPLRALAGWRGRQLAGDVRSVAADAGAGYVDIAGETGPAFRSDPGRHFAADGFHPSDAGYQLWADAVLAAVR